MNLLAAFVEKLKDYLRDNRSEFVEHYSMLGDAEGGFYSADEFNFGALLEEIDKFSETFKNPETCGCPACRDGVLHHSDCAVHNMPAMPNGPCDCGALHAEGSGSE